MMPVFHHSALIGGPSRSFVGRGRSSPRRLVRSTSAGECLTPQSRRGTATDARKGVASGKGAWRDSELQRDANRMMRLHAGAAASGRPSAGQLLKQAFQAAAGQRSIERDLGPLRRLFPYFAAHWPDTLGGIAFTLVSALVPLGLTGAGRQLIDGMAASVHTHAELLRSFLIAGAVAAAF